MLHTNPVTLHPSPTQIYFVYILSDISYSLLGNIFVTHWVGSVSIFIFSNVTNGLVSPPPYISIYTGTAIVVLNIHFSLSCQLPSGLRTSVCLVCIMFVLLLFLVAMQFFLTWLIPLASLALSLDFSDLPWIVVAVGEVPDGLPSSLSNPYALMSYCDNA